MLKIDVNFAGRMTCGFVNDMRNLVNLTWSLKNLKICTLRNLFVQGIYSWAKNYRGLMCHDTEGWCNFKEKLIGGLKNNIRNLVTLMGSFCQQHIKFQLKKYRGVISRDTDGWSKLWRKTNFLLQKWHEEFDEF